MMNRMSAVVFASMVLAVVISLPTPAVSTVAYPACIAPCLAGCWVFPPAYAGCAAGCAAFCTASCFDPSTTITVLRNSTTMTVTAPEIVVGDYVETLAGGGTDGRMWTEVVRNAHTPGNWTFVRFDLESGASLQVTDDHGVLVSFGDGLLVTRASDVLGKSEFFMVDGDGQQQRVMSTESVVSSGRWTVETRAGTVLANNTYCSTVCADMVSTMEPLLKAQERWKEAHDFML